MNQDANGVVVAVCLSPRKGTAKRAVESARLVPDFGVEHDAHGGNHHRQVSLLSHDQVETFNSRGGDVDHGAFGENILVRGIDLKTLPVGSKLRLGPATLELTQIGKDCHTRCHIYYRMGDCIMPREGVFAKVLVGGEIRSGDQVTVLAAEAQ
jgi:MOSC domain-containing protein YiiM